jgi:hypothetical protein
MYADLLTQTNKNGLNAYAFNPFLLVLKPQNASQTAQRTRQSSKLEWPSHPHPLGFEPQDGTHGHGADQKNHPIAAFVVGVLFVVIVICHGKKNLGLKMWVKGSSTFDI